MSKSVANSVLDAALAKIATATTMTLCSQQPTTRTEAITTYKLADVTMTSDEFSAPTDGTTSGRKIAVAGLEDIPVDSSGTGTHVALCDGSELLYVTTNTSQAVVAGNLANISQWVIEIADPT